MLGSSGAQLNEQACGREAGHAATAGRAASMHGGHVGILTNRWQAPEWGRWDAVLGRLGSELIHGPKMKFGLHLMLSNFA